MSSLLQLSGNFLEASFILYLIAILFFGGGIRQNSKRSNKANKWSKIAIIITILGFISQIAYFITRWIAGGHAPVSNMYEFTTFFGIMLVGAFIILYFIYKMNVLGIFTLSLSLLIIVYASMFPSDVSPLIPSLQSHWLFIHVITVAVGQAILSISFVAGLMYLLKVVNPREKSKRSRWLEALMYFVVVTIGFIIITTTFNVMDYKAEFEWVNKDGATVKQAYQVPAIIGPNEGVLLTEGKMEPIIHTPAIIDGKRMNTTLWSFLVGTALYLLIRLIARRPIIGIFHPLMQKVNLDVTDEVGYRSVLIGFPVFSLGGLVFAMIWAQQAWSRFWGWDPKEVWALIIFLFYAAFLHLRLSKGWHGEKSAWLAVIGFAIIMFNLIVVNLILFGLHSYAS